MIGSAMAYSPDQCIASVQEQKRIETQRRIQELRDQRARENAEKAQKEGGTQTQTAPKPSNNSGFGNVFAPNTLESDGN